MSEPRLGPHGLTLRHAELLRLRCVSGKTNAETAAALGISEQTVKNHVTTIFRRLGVVSSEQACYLLGLHDGRFAPVPALRPEVV